MSQAQQSSFRLISFFTGIFVTVLVLVPSTAAKFIAIGPFNISGATLVFPITYFFNDILTEVYGYRRSRQIIWTGLACQVLAAVAYWLVGIWPSAPFWHDQKAYDTILSSAPRVTAASLIAYFCGEFANSVVLSKLKYFQSGKRGMKQAGRFVGSTVVGEAVDSIAFMTIGFWGVLPTPDLLKTIVTIYIFKVLYEIVALPFTVRASNWVKQVEGIDVIDRPERTNYNPFSFASEG
ncbi:MAG: queuosine precursor transporter [Acidobacteriia bacterium]|nr:queuosine precursor transporter [Terriglobia bacterium]